MGPAIYLFLAAAMIFSIVMVSDNVKHKDTKYRMFNIVFFSLAAVGNAAFIVYDLFIG